MLAASRLLASIRAIARATLFRTGLIRSFWTYRHVLDGSYRALPAELVSSDPHRLRLCDLIAAPGCSSLLEVGCANGANLSVLSARLPQCTLAAVDLNAHALHTAVQRVKAVGGNIGTFRIAAADRLPFMDGEFELVLSDAVFMYLTPQVARRALREMHRVSRTRIIIHTFADDSLRTSEIREGNWIHPIGRLIATLAPHATIERERSLLRSRRWQRDGFTYVVTW